MDSEYYQNEPLVDFHNSLGWPEICRQGEPGVLLNSTRKKHFITWVWLRKI